jgi:hypothetical protein
MLAISDKNGIVEASIPGLSDISRVTIDQCIDALDRLSQPDKFSRSTEFDGRRIETVDGGWQLLNYTRYRGKLTQEKIREQTRYRVRKHREKQCNANVTHQPDVTAGNAQSDPDPDPDPESEKRKSAHTRVVYPKDFLTFWKLYPKRVGKKAAFSAWKKATDRPPIDKLLRVIGQQQQSIGWRNGYIPNPATWLNEGRWDDETNLKPNDYGPGVDPNNVR